MRARSLGPVVLLLAAACGGPATPPPPPPASPPATDGLRPLTSRDRDGAQTPAIPEAPGLPPGHPPVDGSSAGGSAEATPLKHGRPVAGTIAIAPALASRLAATDVLYLIARNHKTKAVVAVRRDEGVAFPHAFEIGPDGLMLVE